jgi:hypothetical protein
MAKNTIVLNLDENQIKLMEEALTKAQLEVCKEHEKAKVESNVSSNEETLTKFLSIENVIQQIFDQTFEDKTN